MAIYYFDVLAQFQVFLNLQFLVDFLVLLPCRKSTKKARLNINFTHMYASVKARKTRLDTFVTYPDST